MKALQTRRNRVLAPVSVLAALSLAVAPSLSNGGETFALWRDTATIGLGQVSANIPEIYVPPTGPGFGSLGYFCWALSNSQHGYSDITITPNFPSDDSSAVLVLDLTNVTVRMTQGGSNSSITIDVGTGVGAQTVDYANHNPGPQTALGTLTEFVIVPFGQAANWPTQETRGSVIETDENGVLNLRFGFNHLSQGNFTVGSPTSKGGITFQTFDGDGNPVLETPAHKEIDIPGFGFRGSAGTPQQAAAPYVNEQGQPIQGEVIQGNVRCEANSTPAPPQPITPPNFPVAVLAPLPDEEELDDDPELEGGDDPEDEIEIEVDETDDLGGSDSTDVVDEAGDSTDSGLTDNDPTVPDVTDEVDSDGARTDDEFQSIMPLPGVWTEDELAGLEADDSATDEIGEVEDVDDELVIDEETGEVEDVVEPAPEESTDGADDALVTEESTDEVVTEDVTTDEVIVDETAVEDVPTFSPGDFYVTDDGSLWVLGEDLEWVLVESGAPAEEVVEETATADTATETVTEQPTYNVGDFYETEDGSLWVLDENLQWALVQAGPGLGTATAESGANDAVTGSTAQGTEEAAPVAPTPVYHEFPYDNGRVFAEVNNQWHTVSVRQLDNEFVLVDSNLEELRLDVDPRNDRVVFLYDAEGRTLGAELGRDGWPRRVTVVYDPAVTAARIAAEQEAARIAAEQEAARIWAEQEAARIAAEQEAARIWAEQEAARIAAEQEAARWAAEQEAARQTAYATVEGY